MKVETCVTDWDRICPKCKDKKLSSVTEGVAAWEHEYTCLNCKCRFTVNYGDKMGGGFDVITIIE